jgi:hypothetical protein
MIVLGKHRRWHNLPPHPPVFNHSPNIPPPECHPICQGFPVFLPWILGTGSNGSLCHHSCSLSPPAQLLTLAVAFEYTKFLSMENSQGISQSGSCHLLWHPHTLHTPTTVPGTFWAVSLCIYCVPCLESSTLATSPPPPIHATSQGSGPDP